MATTLWISAAAFALASGLTDLAWRKIPNWLTYPAVPLAIVLHWIVGGWHGALLSVSGAVLGLAIFLPFVLLRQIGGGDWKLIGALGAFLEIRRLILVLLIALIANGLMALILVISRKRLRTTIGNIGRMLASLFSLRAPPPELTIDSSESAKVPFGIAAAIAVLVYAASQPWVAF
ncbi:MAG: prepilin peptidase [Acidobacteria bacterium]|nr:prepilin peptidase [Acidobacteriota bacterium]